MIATVHASAALVGESGVLIRGASGSGKSSLLLALIAADGRHNTLVADDRVEVIDGYASAPESLAGMLEVRGLGIVRLSYLPRAHLALVVELADGVARLPLPALHAELGLPLVRVIAASASAPERVTLALDCALGRVSQVVGAFAG